MQISDAAGVLIGWATVSITPGSPVQLQGQHAERISRSVHDEIKATAMVLDHRVGDRSEQAIFVSCDVVAVPRDLVEELRMAISAKIPKIDPSKVIIAATHTHTGPTLSEHQYPPPPDGVMSPTDYRRFLMSRLIEVIQTAWESRRTALYSSQLGYAAVGFNRRTAYADGSTKMYGNTNDPGFAGMEGGCDHGVELLYTFDAGGGLLGILVNIACPAQVVESNYYISGDFWSSVRRRVCERFGEDVGVLPLCAAAGDQSPRDLVRGDYDGLDFRNESGMEEMGRRIMATIEDRYARARIEKREMSTLSHHVTVIDLPSRRITQEEADSIRAQNAQLKEGNPDPQSSDGGRLRKGKNALTRFETQEDSPIFPVEIHAVRLDGLVFATNPFELFLDFGLRIKARSAADQTFVVQLTGDRGMYLPTPRAIASGHYGTIPTESYVGPDGGNMLVERTVEIIRSLF